MPGEDLVVGATERDRVTAFELDEREGTRFGSGWIDDVYTRAVPRRVVLAGVV